MTITADIHLKLLAIENATEERVPAAERGDAEADKAIGVLMERHNALMRTLVPGLV